MKTRRALLLAMSELLETRRFNNITVQEIIDRADVGRSTFYAHFETKEDLLDALIENIFAMLGDGIRMSNDKDPASERLLPARELFDHVGAHHRLILGLMRAEHADALQDRIKTYWSDRILEVMRSREISITSRGVPVEIYAYQTAATLVSLQIWWLKNQMPYSPEQMEDYFEALVGLP
jgi:AcrR family transcriptional regulator